MSKFQFGDKVSVTTFTDSGKYGIYTFTVRGYLVVGGKRYTEILEMFPTDQFKGNKHFGPIFNEKFCRPA